MELSWRTRRFIVRAKRVGPVLAGGLAAVVFIGYAASTVPMAVDHWRSRALIRNLAREAARLGLGYSDVVALGTRASDKPVRWLIFHPTADLWHHAGDPSQRIAWAGRAPDIPPIGKASRPEWIVATVVSSKPHQVTLDYKGRD